MRVRPASPGIEAIERRIRAIDRSRIHFDRDRAETALRRHFAAASFIAPGIEWMDSLPQAFRQDRPLRPWNPDARGRGHATDPIGHPPRWTLPEIRTNSGVSPWYVQPLFRGLVWTPLDMAVLEHFLLRDAAYPPEPEAAGEPPRSAGLGGTWCLYCGRDRVGIWAPLIEAFEAGLWIYWILADRVLAVPRPATRGEGGRLHAETSPAVEWPDGEARWFYEGIHMPRRYVADFDQLTAAEIRDVGNLEVRHLLIRRYGEARFLQDLDAVRLAEDRFGMLYRLDLPGDEPLVMVRVLNSTPEPDGSRKPYFLRVPPDVRTPQEAVAWSFGLRDIDYAPSIET